MKEGPTSPTRPFAPYPPLPPPEFRSRAPEFYGFVAFTSTYLGFVVFLLWALLPDNIICALGITWYPNREWAILVPAWSVTMFLLAYFVYFALAIFQTPAFSEMKTVTDNRAHFPPIKPRERIEKGYSPFAKQDSIPELYDIPLGLANRVLYRQKRSSSGRRRIREGSDPLMPHSPPRAQSPVSSIPT
ncbi:PIG-P-domain-containing protein [Cylindrobasidium torrendii FP15055 ss-10]|uniref:PIG-P-domain-containing protein n=1 Tax=Cylindrobasidium torrendii FP15055 ss-10 TaxID=1314674 RepID=A0A0D7B8S4_9AGAR|nr:PIG-P-domain-containing protein [Cylindrobasidium torrendii FP15055 ss-10]